MLQYLVHLRIEYVNYVSYSPKEGEKEYEEAYKIGRELGLNGFSIVYHIIDIKYRKMEDIVEQWKLYQKELKKSVKQKQKE